MTQEKKTFRPIISSEICLIYELLHNQGLVSFPLTQDAEHKVEALTTNINATYFGTELYPATEEKCIAYLFFMIKDHPFTDGNKRTASLTFEIACDFNNLVPHYGDFSLDELAVFIEKIHEPDPHLVIGLLAGVLFPSQTAKKLR